MLGRTLPSADFAKRQKRWTKNEIPSQLHQLCRFVIRGKYPMLIKPIAKSYLTNERTEPRFGEWQ